MHVDLGGLWIFLWIFGWGAWSYLEDREHNKKRLAILDLIHKERIYAMDKGLPYPEMPPYQMEEPEPPKSTSLAWQTLAGWGIVSLVTGAGSTISLRAVSNRYVSGYWPLGTIPFWIGLGLLACAWLYKRNARA